MGGVATKMIEANTTIPTNKKETYSTAADNQPSVDINIVQGERPIAKDNKSLGRFHLDGIPPMRRGEPQIEVTFDVDANGILNVSAKELKTGKEQSIRIEASSGLSDEDIERMKREADEHADADAAAKEKVDKVNAADSLVFQVEKQLEDIKDKVDEAKLAPVKESVEELKKAHASQDIPQIDAATEKVNGALQAIQADVQAAYAQQQQAGGDAGAQPEADKTEGTADQEVTDVDFEEVK
jgi:molecular chaperone DnaK